MTAGLAVCLIVWGAVLAWGLFVVPLRFDRTDLRSRLSAAERVNARQSADLDTLSRVAASLTITNQHYETMNQLVRTALVHSLNGRDDEAYAILGELDTTPPHERLQ